jgi:hypothetical protein
MIEHTHHHFVDVVTSAPATTTTLVVGASTFLVQLPVLIQILTLVVLTAQIVALGYKLYTFITEHRE